MEQTGMNSQLGLFSQDKQEMVVTTTTANKKEKCHMSLYGQIIIMNCLDPGRGFDFD